MTGIYKITINDHYIYIGQSVDIENRWRQHLSTLQNLTFTVPSKNHLSNDK